MKIFEELQSVGKALMLPVAVLPAAAILLRFGADDVLNIDVLEKAGGAIFDNLPIIFAIGIAFGLAKDTNNNGAAALAGFVCYSVLTATLKALNAEINMGVLAGIAMYRTAKPENRAKIAGALASMALASFLTGITEPIEFSFMFIAPMLYAIHAILIGASMWICYELGILVGCGFSPSCIDLILSWGISTRPAMIIPVGLAFGAIYYFISSWAIVKFNLPTIGRYEEEISADKTSYSSDFAKKIINGLGGTENLQDLSNCATRLRVTVKDFFKVDEKLLKSAGAKGVFKKNNAIQVVIGTKVEFVADEINSILRRV